MTQSHHRRARARALVVAALTLVAVAASALPVGAWSNGPAAGGVTGNGYGTHDWIIDQAVKVFAGKVPAWFEADTARLASDDHDTLYWRTNEHVYMESGYGRGAVYMIGEYYDRAIAQVRAGNGHQASIYIGWLAHFWGDILQPYHTAYAANGKSGPHAKYEALVDDRMRKSSDASGWQTADRTPGKVTNSRTLAIAAATYSRNYFKELDAELAKSSALTSRASQISGYLMTKASRELADIIYSIDLGVGNAPGAKSITVTRKYAQPTSIEYQAIYVKVLDTAGKPIEGARVDVTWPSSADVPNGAEPVAHIFRAYTMADGVAKATAYIDLDDGQVKTVTIKVSIRGQTLTATTTYQAKSKGSVTPAPEPILLRQAGRLRPG